MPNLPHERPRSCWFLQAGCQRGYEEWAALSLPVIPGDPLRDTCRISDTVYFTSELELRYIVTAVGSDLTLAEETLVITHSEANHLWREHLNEVRTFRNVTNELRQLLFHNLGVGGIVVRRPSPPFVTLSSLCVALWWNFHSGSVKLYPPLYE